MELSAQQAQAQQLRKCHRILLLTDITSRCDQSLRQLPNKCDKVIRSEIVSLVWSVLKACHRCCMDRREAHVQMSQCCFTKKFHHQLLAIFVKLFQQSQLYHVELIGAYHSWDPADAHVDERCMNGREQPVADIRISQPQ